MAAYPLASLPQPQQAAFEDDDDLSLCLVYPDFSDPDTTVKEEFDAGDLVCGGCELVLGDRVVDTQSEWRTFENDQGDDPSSAIAADPLMEGMEQLDTIIGFKDGRAATCSRSERHLSAVRDISSWCDQYSLPKTISDITKQLYKRANEEKLLRRKPPDAVIAACVFLACRQARVPRTFSEICSLTHVSKKLLGRCYKTLERAFNLSPRSSAARSGVAEPEDLLVRYCNHLDIPPHVQAICKDIIVAVREHGIADGRNPISITSGAIYFACVLLGVSKTMKDISMVTGVYEGTIKIVYRLYCTNRQKLVKKEWVAEGKTNTDPLRQKLVEGLSPPA
ncbi:cyclin-like protein [Lactarius hengduanensis]|nr:cyclin-like protein [Lactarius hengduanensis]